MPFSLADGGAKLRSSFQIKNRNCLRFKFPDLLFQKPNIGMGSERLHFNGVLPFLLYTAHNVERLCADGPGRAEQS